MLTDTFTARAFFTDFQSDIPRALRWTTLRQDSGDPMAFVKLAKAEWETVEAKAGLGEQERKDRVKRVIFSDGLDVERAVRLQKGCDELGIGGESELLNRDMCDRSDLQASNLQASNLQAVAQAACSVYRPT